MKKDALLFIFAGFILGSVLTFVAIKTLEQKNEQSKLQNQMQMEGDLSAEKHFEMMQNFIKFAEENPNDFKSRITLGNIYYDKGKYKEAIKWYEEALKIDPQNSDLLVDIGACYQEEDPKKSIEYFDKALLIDPSKQQALYNKVIVYLFNLKDIKAAEENLKIFEEKYPNFPMLEKIKKEIEKEKKEK